MEYPHYHIVYIHDRLLEQPDQNPKLLYLTQNIVQECLLKNMLE